MRLFILAGLIFASVVCAAEQPQISADLGPCTANFTVTDTARKPLYDAKIHTIIRYGFLSKRKIELDIGTDSNGRARFVGLPHEVKKAIEFTIRSQDRVKTITHDPATNCHANFDVSLRAGP